MNLITTCKRQRSQMSKIVQFIDIETTHLQAAHGEIIEIAILTSFDGGRTIAERWIQKITPEHLETADPIALEINGYTAEFWEDAPAWVYVLPVVAEKILRDAIIVAHNVIFDSTWIEHQIQKEFPAWRMPRNKICTKSLALEHLPTAPSSSLSYLRKLFFLNSINAHTAGKDALDCYIIFNKLNRAGVILRLYWRYRIWRLKAKEKALID